MPTIQPLGDQGICINWGNSIDERIHVQVLTLYEQVRRAAIPGVLNLVPAYCSLSIIFDAPKLLRAFPGKSPFEYMRNRIAQLLKNPSGTTAVMGRLLEIPVCYDLSLAPDLGALARQKQLSVTEFVRIHTGREYRVFMLGFLPGFPYMGTLDERLAAPRLSSPRRQVPAGSVGIAGQQTGIYPLESPGGWNLIGRTPSPLFDPTRTDPVLLRPGDRVRFVEISLAAYREKSKEA